MVAQQHENGFQRVSLSSSDSGHEQTETDTEPCAEALSMEIDEMSSGTPKREAGVFSPKRTLSPCNYCVKKLGVLTMKSYGPPPVVLHL